MNILPLFRTDRLILRQMKAEDIPFLAKHANNKNIAHRIINIPYPYQEHDAAFRMSYIIRGFKERSRFIFAICKKEENELIGEISLHLKNNKIAELGFWLGELFWKQGIVTEAAAPVLQFGFETLELSEIDATCHQDNIGSNRVCIKSNMKLIGNAGNVNTYSIKDVG